MKLNMPFSSDERTEGDLPELPILNMYAEQSASEGVVLQSRRGLDASSIEMDDSPVEALFSKDGIAGGALLAVSGGGFYDNGTRVGDIDGDGFASIDGNESGAFVTVGNTVYLYAGGVLSPIAFPDGASVTRVVTGASRAIFLRADSDKFYWTSVLGTDVDALDFATAESQSDRLLDALFIDDALMLFGSETVEFWPNTGGADLPFQPLEGRVLERGVKATGCATLWGNSFAFIGDDNVIYDPNMQQLSNAGLEEKIAKSDDCRLFNFRMDGHDMLACRVDSGTWARSSRTGLWSQMATYGQSNWVAQCFAAGVFGSAIDGKTYEFGSDYSDDGDILERRFRSGVPLNGAPFHVDNVRLRLNPGQTPYLEGQYSDPMVEMRKSSDAGQTWGDYKPRSLAEQGDYAKDVIWRAQGMASRPGFFAEFRVTDPVPLRASGAFVNEQYGGR